MMRKPFLLLFLTLTIWGHPTVSGPQGVVVHAALWWAYAQEALRLFKFKACVSFESRETEWLGAKENLEE